MPAPLLGQHTVAVLQEIGYDAATIRELAAAGVIRL
jgi:crotonobetainyl-CoA:carnitine CoA-transferase CaiB-like acyl-CoA transferase